MKKFLSFIGLLFCAIACKNTSAPATGQIIAQQEITNQIYFAAKPIVSAHRGGGGEGLKGYPENCLESIQYLSSKGVHSFEIDIFENSAYIIKEGISSEDIMELITRVEKNEIAITRLVVYPYSVPFNVLHEMKRNFKNLRGNKELKLIERY